MKICINNEGRGQVTLSVKLKLSINMDEVTTTTTTIDESSKAVFKQDISTVTEFQAHSRVSRLKTNAIVLHCSEGCNTFPNTFSRHTKIDRRMKRLDVPAICSTISRPRPKRYHSCVEEGLILAVIGRVNRLSASRGVRRKKSDGLRSTSPSHKLQVSRDIELQRLHSPNVSTNQLRRCGKVAL